MKKWMKTASGLKIQQLDIQQQALKLTANRFLVLFRLLICCPHLDYISLVLQFIFLFIYLFMYIWMGTAVCMDAWGFRTRDFMQSHWQSL